MNKIISCCGVVCSECQYYPIDCKGCPPIKGEVFWLEYTNEKVCAIYDCCLNIKKLTHCGKCKELPCDRYHGFDPTKTPEENESDLIKQLTLLRLMD